LSYLQADQSRIIPPYFGDGIVISIDLEFKSINFIDLASAIKTPISRHCILFMTSPLLLSYEFTGALIILLSSPILKICIVFTPATHNNFGLFGTNSIE
jgi:hypothetical protein